MMTQQEPAAATQDKSVEVAFFDGHATGPQEYNVFSEATNDRLIDLCLRCCGLSPGAAVLDLGCGSGVFSHYLARRGLRVTGADLSPKLIELGRRLYPNVTFAVEDAEHLSFADGTFDCVFLGGVIHHFPDPTRMAAEVARVLRPRGTFFAFDPNRRNPFMYLYRDRSSPFYSPVGVTPNERPVLEEEVRRVFGAAGFAVESAYTSVSYRYVASSLMRWLLPAYNLAERVLFAPRWAQRRRAFLVTWGVKQQG